MEDDVASSSFPDSGCSYTDVSIYVDAVSSSRVIAWLRDCLGLEGGGQCLMMGPVQVSGVYNDYATGRTAHPFDFLEWPTVLECEALAGSPADVVAAVADVLEALWRGGFKALAACDFEGELPACGGRTRYPMPAGPEGIRALTGTWWQNLLAFGKGKN